MFRQGVPVTGAAKRENTATGGQDGCSGAGASGARAGAGATACGVGGRSRNDTKPDMPALLSSSS